MNILIYSPEHAAQVVHELPSDATFKVAFDDQQALDLARDWQPEQVYLQCGLVDLAHKIRSALPASSRLVIVGTWPANPVGEWIKDGALADEYREMRAPIDAGASAVNVGRAS